jgi:hypothetical protein
MHVQKQEVVLFPQAEQLGPQERTGRKVKRRLDVLCNADRSTKGSGKVAGGAITWTCSPARARKVVRKTS